MMEQLKNISDAELTYGNDCPYIDIQWQKGRVFISSAVFRLIGKPSRIRFLWNEAKRTLIIVSTSIGDPEGFPVIGKTYVRNGSLFVGSVTLINEIWKIIKWDKSLRLRVVARYNELSNVAIFEMKNAIASKIQRNIHGNRSRKNIQ